MKLLIISHVQAQPGGIRARCRKLNRVFLRIVGTRMIAVGRLRASANAPCLVHQNGTGF